MSDSLHPPQDNPVGARVYEFRDFVPLKSGGLYVQVSHQRTVFQADGNIHKEVFATEALLEPMIRAFQGKVYRSAGTLNAFFEDLEQAKACAQAISTYHGRSPEICGTQISIPV